MRKLVESTLVSLDGVIESPDRWSLFDDEASQLSMQELEGPGQVRHQPRR